jgi:uroporphyrin-III C-methyltransferase
MADADRTGIVYLVGAGPGDVGLLTLRAVECLRQADFVLYDYLTSPRALDFAQPHAELLCVDQLPGAHPQRWPHIHDRIIAEARNGRVVVHLKGGDPLIFGRGGEEAEACRDAGVPVEVVPGVSSALAGPTSAGIPVTARGVTQSFTVVSAHVPPGDPASTVDWDALARLGGTLVLLMAVGRLREVCAALVAGGRDPATPVAVVQDATLPGERTVVTTLARAESDAADVRAPAVVVVGEVVRERVVP